MHLHASDSEERVSGQGHTFPTDVTYYHIGLPNSKAERVLEQVRTAEISAILTRH
jgi:hypothetical protein